MKRSTVLVACLCLVIQPYLALAESSPSAGADTRIYLADGSLVEGTLVEKDQDLVIIRVKEKIFTFDKTEIDKIITLESLGGGAQNITVTEFPYISFLGGAVAFSLLSWLQFDRASDNDAEAALNREHGPAIPVADGGSAVPTTDGSETPSERAPLELLCQPRASAAPISPAALVAVLQESPVPPQV